MWGFKYPEPESNRYNRNGHRILSPARLPIPPSGQKVVLLLKEKSERRDSNSRPQPWQGCALPTELLSHLISQKACKWWCKYIYFLFYSNSWKVFFAFFFTIFDILFTINYLLQNYNIYNLVSFFYNFPYLSITKMQ